MINSVCLTKIVDVDFSRGLDSKSYSNLRENFIKLITTYNINMQCILSIDYKPSSFYVGDLLRPKSNHTFSVLCYLIGHVIEGTAVLICYKHSCFIARIWQRSKKKQKEFRLNLRINKIITITFEHWVFNE